MVNPIIEKAAQMSQLKLEQQHKAADFADQRAISFAGVQIAISAILCGLASGAPFPAGMYLGALVLLVSAALSWWSLLPSKLYVVGAKFSDFEEDIEMGQSMNEILSQIGKHSDTMYEKNKRIRGNLLAYFKWSVFVSIVGIAFTIASQAYWHYF